MKFNKATQVIEKKQVITFDVFDTLINRFVDRPEDIFKYVEKRFDRDYKKQSFFYFNRIKAEKEARKLHKSKEICLSDIYEQLRGKYTPEELNTLNSLEICTEIEFSIGNQKIISMFNYAKEKGKELYIISDMYLPTNVIEAMLKKNGISGYKKIYVSGTYRKTKSSGELFAAFLKERHIKPADMMHIGDNKLADYKRPREYGIEAYLIKNDSKVRRLEHVNKLIDIKNLDKLEYNLINNYVDLKFTGLSSVFTPAYEAGYQVFGPFLFGYTKWLIEQCKDNNINTVLFCSRDGYLLKKCFDLLYSEGRIRTFYFYGSRKAVVTPNFQYDNTIVDMLNRYKSMPLSFDFNFICGKVGIQRDKKNSNLFNKYNGKIYTKDSLFDVEGILGEYIPFIHQHSKEQGTLLLEYLDTLLGNNSNNVALVDIGGNRTIEKNLRAFLKKNMRMNWNLFSFSLEMLDSESPQSKAYLYSRDHDWYLCQMIMPFYYFLEIMLSAPHGSVKGYYKRQNQIYPILGHYDYGNDKTDEKKIVDLQRGILHFINDFSNIGKNYMNLNGATCFQNIFEFGMFPSRSNCAYWKDFLFNADELMPLVSSANISHYIYNPGDIHRDYQRSLWKSGFLAILLHTSKFNGIIYKIKHKLKA